MSQVSQNTTMGRKRKPLAQLDLTNDKTPTTTPKKKRSSPNETHQILNTLPVKRAGIITRMVLRNFLCHSLLEVDLHDNINFIIGRNGSGKSALLTAVIVGLGGKASLTNRGHSVKNFVKAGKTSATVEIQLYNGGPMAYRPKDYGEQITVIRNITASGSSSYKLKSENGAIVATQLRELHNITTSLNIQIDNPVCILNQDTSRNFLNSTDPKNKFTLFMKATKLDALFEQFKTIKAHKQDAIRLFEHKHECFNKLLRELTDLKRKIDNRKSIVSIRDKIKLLQIELLWTKVRDAEEDVKKNEKSVEDWMKKQGRFLEECSNRSTRLENLKSNIMTLTQQINELKEALQVQLRPQRDVNKIIEDLRAKYNDKRRDKHLISGMIETKSKEAEILEREIANANENLSRVEQEKMQRLRELTTMKDKIKAMDHHLETCRNDLYQISSDIPRREDERETLRRDLNHIEHQLTTERNKLNALKTESGNTLLLYGRDIPRVKQLIEQNKHKFKHVPRGPLGSYIKLKDRKWAVAVESYLMPGLLGSFAVDNVNDNQLLMQIFGQVWTSGRKPTVITSQFFFKKHDVRKNLVQPPKDCVSLYDVLEIEDPIVANCLVDQARIEGVLLLPDNEKAMQLLSDVRYVPQNCQQGITIKGDKYFPDPNYKTYGSTYHTAQYLQVDTKEYIVQLTQKIQELSAKKESVTTEFQSILKDLREQNSKKTELEQKIEKIRLAKIQIRKQLDQLQATAEPEVASVDILENELSDIRNSIQEKSVQLGVIDEALKEIKSEINSKIEKLQGLKSANSNLEERLRSLEEQINEDQIKQREIATGDEFEKRKAKEFETKLNEARSELVLKQNTVKKYTEQATVLGERPKTNKKVPDIVNEINNLERSVQRIETTTENIEELVDKYRTMHENYTNLSTLLTCLNCDIKELSVALEKRLRHYKQTESYFITFIKQSFKRIMEVRRFEGSVEINMNEKKLELTVVPQHGSQTKTSNLSGGERSFATIAFLYSLWQCMQFPFYLLDEFDVFMDKLNRTKVIEILMHHAETHQESQFVFLTPQDVSFVNKGTILRLQDPERNSV